MIWYVGNGSCSQGYRDYLVTMDSAVAYAETVALHDCVVVFPFYVLCLFSLLTKKEKTDPFYWFVNQQE